MTVDRPEDNQLNFEKGFERFNSGFYMNLLSLSKFKNAFLFLLSSSSFFFFFLSKSRKSLCFGENVEHHRQRTEFGASSCPQCYIEHDVGFMKWGKIRKSTWPE